MSKNITTIQMAEHDLRAILEFKAKSIERAINSETNSEIQDLRRKLLRELNLAITSINQDQLPFASTDAADALNANIKKTR